MSRAITITLSEDQLERLYEDAGGALDEGDFEFTFRADPAKMRRHIEQTYPHLDFIND